MVFTAPLIGWFGIAFEILKTQGPRKVDTDVGCPEISVFWEVAPGTSMMTLKVFGQSSDLITNSSYHELHFDLPKTIEF